MLFNDSDFISSLDMLALDPSVKTDSLAASITLDGPSGLAAQACDEVGQKLLNANQAYTGFMPPFSTPHNQTAAVLNLIGPSVNRSRVALSQIVISPDNPTESSTARPSPLKRYAIYVALEMFYRMAYHRKQDDRFEKKMTLYSEEIRKKYWPRFFNQGVPIVYKPLAAPGALHEWNAGTWDQTLVSQVAGGSAVDQAFYDVAITWVDQTKYVSPASKGNAESAPSARQDISVDPANVIQVDITPLNAPNGTAPLNVTLGQGLVIPGNASGWNVYVGAQGGALFLQNAVPIDIGTKLYTLAADPVLSGYTADAGQYAESHLTMQTMVMRG